MNKKYGLYNIFKNGAQIWPVHENHAKMKPKFDKLKQEFLDNGTDITVKSEDAFSIMDINYELRLLPFGKKWIYK